MLAINVALTYPETEKYESKMLINKVKVCRAALRTRGSLLTALST